MLAYKVLIDGLTIAGAVRHQGEVVPGHLIAVPVLQLIQAEAPNVGDVFQGKLMVVEMDVAHEALELLAEPDLSGPAQPYLDPLRPVFVQKAGPVAIGAGGPQPVREGFEQAQPDPGEPGEPRPAEPAPEPGQPNQEPALERDADLEPEDPGEPGPQPGPILGPDGRWTGKGGKVVCGHPLDDGRHCGVVVKPGGRCRHHRVL